MRYNDFKTQPINEIAMNPTAYNKSLENSDGVKVGFEFECYVPKSSLDDFRNNYTGDNDAFINNEDALNEIKTQTLSEFLEKIENMVLHRQNAIDLFAGNVFHNDGRSIWELYKGDLSNQFKNRFNRAVDFELDVIRVGADADQVESKFKQVISSLLRLHDIEGDFHINDEFSNRLYRLKDLIETFVDESNTQVKHVGNRLSHWWEASTSQLSNASFIDWVNNQFGTDSMGDLLNDDNEEPWQISSRLLTLITEDHNAASSDETWDSTDTGYSGTSKMMKLVLDPLFGPNITIFNRYHQEGKHLDRWYIEPDGSLNEPQSYGDQGVEIVGPPEPATIALSTLTKFFNKVKEYGVYTNESTGLHMNVSVPTTLDVLKLAIIVGDEHIIDYYKRGPGTKGANYVHSVIVSLRNQIGRGSNSGDNYNELSPDVMREQLKQIAEYISDRHMASVNFNGNYVSFRAAGNDYLNDPKGVIDTFGRFVRAMMIASDPTAYKDEYLKKLTAFVEKSSPQATFQSTDERVAYLRQHGIPALKVIGARVNKEDYIDPAQIMNKARRRNRINFDPLSGAGYQIFYNDESTKRAVVTGKGFSRVTREKLEVIPVDHFFSIIIYPKTYEQYKQFINATVDNNAFNGHEVGVDIVPIYCLIDKYSIERDSPSFNQIYTNLYKSIMKGTLRSFSPRANVP